MEKRIIFATGNQNKMKEIHMILADLGMPIYSMKEAGIDIDIVEDGTTFEENAQIKAKAIAKYLPDDIILADDSGLEIDYLNKEPGIYSARYAGVDTSYDIKNQMLLDRLEGVPDEKSFATNMIREPKVRFFPGKALRVAKSRTSFEKIALDDKAEDNGGGSGGDRPEIE